MIKKNKLAILISASLINMSIINNVFADDIEIYTGSKDKEANVNILFMLDTSGSMGENLSAGKTRMDQAQEALINVISNLKGNVRVGFGRFNDPGGSILTPIRRLDEVVDEDIIKTADSDAIENISDSIVSTKEPELIFNNTSKKYIYSVDVVNDLQTAAECSDSSNYISTNTFLNMGYSPMLSCSPYNGFIIKNVNIDKNSEIDSVEYSLQSFYKPTTEVTSTFYYEDTANPANFKNENSYNETGLKITDRSIKETNDKWIVDSSDGTSRISYTGEALKNIFQKQINNKYWKKGSSSLNFYIKSNKTGSNNHNWFLSSAAFNSSTNNDYENFMKNYNRKNQYSTKNNNRLGYNYNSYTSFLNENYVDSWLSWNVERDILLKNKEYIKKLNSIKMSTNEKNYYPKIDIKLNEKSENIVAIKFKEINAPSQSTVRKGILKLIAEKDNGSGKITFKISKNRFTKDFTETNGLLSKEQKTGTLTLEYKDWKKGQPYLFDIKSLLEEKFYSNWCGGGDVTIYMSSSDAKSIYSTESNDGNKPSLILNYDGGNENSCMSSKGIYQITNSFDDSNEKTSYNFFYGEEKTNLPNNEYIQLSGNNKAGFIFRDTKIPVNSKITSAYFEITNYDDIGSGILEIGVGNPEKYPIEQFSNSDGELSERYNKNSYIVSKNWYINKPEPNITYKSPDLSKYIQSVVDSKNFKDAKEKDLEIFLKNKSNGNFSMYSFDKSENKSAKLIINFENKKKETTKFLSSKQIINFKNNETDNRSNNVITVRDKLIELIKRQPTEGGTPIDGALYEAGQYFIGNDVHYGRSKNTRKYFRSRNGRPYYPSYEKDAIYLNKLSKYKEISSPNTYKGGDVIYPKNCSKNNINSLNCNDIYINGNPKYKTPMTEKVCETNNIILITDGDPSSKDYTSYNYIRSSKDINGKYLVDLIKDETKIKCSDTWSCINNWVSYLNKTDFMPLKPGKSNITTHVIGYTQLDSKDKLEQVARNGGGLFLGAKNANQLVDSLTLVISNIMDIETTLATPGVAVNQNNRLQNLSEIYYSVFKPTTMKSWSGNLKKYEVSTEKSIIVDKFKKEAVNLLTGFFEKDTTSFWSTKQDGGNVLIGGAASHLSLKNKIYTYINDNPKEELLNQAKNEINEFNPYLTINLFNLQKRIQKNDYIKFLRWLRGVDVFDENVNGSFSDARQIMGDPLHSRPVLVNYNKNESVIYVSTNDGFLHATDSKTGENIFSFIPKELLKNSYNIYKNGMGKHVYGLDSSWVALRHDENKDGEINKNDGDYIYLYSGMRRGGNSFFALDVTDPKNPILKFVKDKDSEPAFRNIGETWSEPALGRIRLEGKEQIVILFGGGYDKAYDNSSYNNLHDNIGNKLYMINAETGELIWSASGSNSIASTKIAGMNYSIVSKPKIIDLKGNGFISNIYVSDLGGQIIKFKFNKDAKSKSDLFTGKIIAKLGRSVGTLNLADNRMLFDSVAVAPVKNGNEKFVSIVAGTGYRAHPLNKEIHDVIVMIKDKEDFATKNEVISKPIILDDLVDITKTFNTKIINESLKNKKGYLINLKEPSQYIGEKTTGEPLIYDNQIIINTYIPSSKQGECSPVIGYARSYRINVFTGRPINKGSDSDGDGDDAIKQSDRYKDNITTGIANGSKLIYTSDGVFLLTNTKIEKIGSGGKLGTQKKSWYVVK